MGRDPAIGILELSSIAAGIETGDAMVKASPVGSIYAGSVHPGKYVILVSGDIASVEVAMEVGGITAGAALLDRMLLPDVHPRVVAAITSDDVAAMVDAESLGIVETATVAAVVDAADAGVKAAAVSLPAVRLADGLGGKGYALFSGFVAEVEAAIEAAALRLEDVGLGERGERMVSLRVIPQLHEEMRSNLARELRFRRRVVARASERGT